MLRIRKRRVLQRDARVEVRDGQGPDVGREGSDEGESLLESGLRAVLGCSPLLAEHFLQRGKVPIDVGGLVHGLVRFWRRVRARLFRRVLL